MTHTSHTAISSSNKRIVFFGNERLVSGLPETNAPILKGLIERGYMVVAVVSHHSDSKSRNKRPLEVAEIAKAHNIPLFLPNNPSDIIDDLRSLNPDIGVLVAYGRIISRTIIDLFPHGIVNIHPSLLPRYRGSTPIESAILHGDTETGVSIMQLSPGMDEGPVYAQAAYTLSGDESKFTLYNELSELGTTLFFDTFPSILDGSLSPTPQDSSRVTYTSQFSKADSLLDPLKYSAAEAERRVRAHAGFPKTKLTFHNQLIIITKAHVASTPKTPLDVRCRDGVYLAIDELIAPSGKQMNAAAFLNGYAAGA